MRALCLRRVNLSVGRVGEEQSEERIGEDGRGFADGVIERGVAIVHERSPLETTHDDLRLAVEPASGGCDWRGVLPCSLTIYARSLGSVRVGCQMDQIQVGVGRNGVSGTTSEPTDHPPTGMRSEPAFILNRQSGPLTALSVDEIKRVL